jgi:hypothetical protein
VLGSDSVSTVVYGGKVYWFWGDTNRPAYPLGNFHAPGATSLLPGQGGLDPNVGVELSYFVDDQGFARPMARMPGDGPTWIDGLVTLRDQRGRERMFASYAKIKPPMEVYRRGLAEYDGQLERFEQVAEFDINTPLFPGGHSLVLKEQGAEYVYFCKPYPLVRAPATPEGLRDLTRYEAYTCLEEGSTLEKPQIDRRGGKPHYAWRKNAPAVDAGAQARLVKGGHLKQDEGLLQLRDRDTGKPVLAHSGSVAWNAYRGRWILIAVELFGTSVVGEVWYAEADSLLGPWTEAVKVVTHDRYSFYNPKHHAMFDQQGGRIIFFEGTYTHTFSGNTDPTPRYDYNQLMYKLDLADERLALPPAASGSQQAAEPSGMRP